MSKTTDSGFAVPRVRPGGRSERVRRAVFEATLNSMLENGYGNLTIPDVAREAGVHPTTIYRRWGSKGMLALDVIANISTETAPAPNTGSLRGDLTDFVNSVAGSLRVKPVRELARSLVGLNDEDAVKARGVYRDKRVEIVEKIIQQAVERGELENPPSAIELIEVATSAIWMRALVTDLRFEQDFVDRQINAATDFALNGPRGEG